MLRNTSPIGWIPLLAIKIIYEGAFYAFLKAGFFVSIPILGLAVTLDTLYYHGEIDGLNWVFTSINFIQKNIIEGLSEYFGTSPFDFYFNVAPVIYGIMYPAVIFS